MQQRLKMYMFYLLLVVLIGGLFQNCVNQGTSFYAEQFSSLDQASEKTQDYEQNEVVDEEKEKLYSMSVVLQSEKGIVNSDVPFVGRIKVLQQSSANKLPERLKLSLLYSVDLGNTWQKIIENAVDDFSTTFITKDFTWNPGEINVSHFLFRIQLWSGNKQIVDKKTEYGEYVFKSFNKNRTDMNVYVVDPKNGDDNFSGKEIFQPWKTLEYAFSKIKPGDVVLLRGRVFAEDNLVLNVAKSSNKMPTIVRSYGNELPLLQSALVLNKQKWEKVSDGSVQYFRYKLSEKQTVIIDKLHSASIKILAGEFIGKLFRLTRYECKYDLLAQNEKYSKEYSEINAKCLHIKMKAVNLSALNVEQLDLISKSNVMKNADTYLGPGFYFDKINGELIVRLQNSNIQNYASSEQQKSEAESFFRVFEDNVNPQDNEMIFGMKDIGIKIGYVKDSGFVTENLVISGLKFQHYVTALRVYSALNLFLKNNQFLFSKQAITLQNSSKFPNKNILIEKSIFDSKFPRYVSWADVKQDFYFPPFLEKKMDNIKTSGIGVDHANREVNSDLWLENIVVRNNQFIDVFDGLVLGGETRNWSILNNYFSVLDDSLQMDVRVYNLEFAGNLVLGPGVSHDDSGYTCYDYTELTEIPQSCLNISGLKYIHHNVIDVVSKKIFFGRPYIDMINAEIVGFTPHQSFPSHLGQISKVPNISDPWKVYHNLVIFDGIQSGIAGVGGATSIKHQVVNNLIVQKGNQSLVYNADLNRDEYAGNIYVREQVTTNPWFARKNKEPLSSLSPTSELQYVGKINFSNNYQYSGSLISFMPNYKLSQIPSSWPMLRLDTQDKSYSLLPGWEISNVNTVTDLPVACFLNQALCSY